MVRTVDFQNEFQFHAAEVGRVGREGIFAAKLLAADLPALDPLPDGLSRIHLPWRAGPRANSMASGSRAGVCFIRLQSHESPLTPSPSPRGGERGAGRFGHFSGSGVEHQELFGTPLAIGLL